MDGMTAPQARPLALPRLTREDAAQANAQGLYRMPVPLPGADGFQLLLQDFPGPIEPGSLVLIEATLDDAPLRAWLPRQLTHDLIGAMGNTIAVDELPPDVAGLMMEVSVINLLLSLEGTLGRSLAVRRMAPEASAMPPGARLTLEGPDNAWPLFVECDDETAEALLGDWPIGERDMDFLPLTARVRAGATVLGLRVARSLRAGDVVLVQHRLPAAGHAVLVVAERFCAIVGVEEGGVTLASPLQPERGTWTMSDEEEGPEAEGHDLDVDDMPVRLAFDLGRLDVPLGQVKQLAPGAVLPLGRAASGFVEISANGARVGRGELVDVDGALGVRIISLFGA